MVGLCCVGVNRMPAPDRRQAVEDKKKGRIIYKGLWTDEEDQMLRSLVAKMADLPRSAPASCSSSRRFT